MITPKIISVSQLNFYVKSLLDSDEFLNYVFVTGEISNLKDHYSSGHLYMSLKDDKSVINSVMFAGYAKTLRFKPQNGMNIIARGRVTIYEPTGQYQLYIEDMQPDGIGALSLAFEQLKEKLNKEGLFSNEHKKPIPKYPHTIGVITSPTGAAVQDIRNILLRRYPNINIVLAPVLVQGENAPKQLTEAINMFDEYNACDLIIIGRGGGSIEDLWAFNDETLARAVYNCKIPVISAVGHETDFTICDFVADLRAPTPSAAAELAVPDRVDLISNLDAQKQYINSMLNLKLKTCTQKLSQLNARADLCSPLNIIEKQEHILEILQSKVQLSVQNVYQKSVLSVKELSAKAQALNPIAVLSRGYSVVTKSEKTVTSVRQLNKDDIINLNFKDGKTKAKIMGE